MNLTKTFTQGGQVTIHNLRMVSQVMKTTVVIGLTISLAFFVAKTWTDTTWPEKRAIGIYYFSAAKLAIPFGKREFKKQTWWNRKGQYTQVRCVDIVKNTGVKQMVNQFEEKFVNNLFYMMLVMFGSMMAVGSIWYYRGRVLKRKNIVKGSFVVDSKELAKIIKKDKKASDIELAGVPLLKDSEVLNILMVGTIGSGKSNAFNHILPQIRHRNDKAVIVDTTGEYLARYYNPETDFLLNPLDERSQPWDMWAECSDDIQVDDLAAGMIPQSLNDPFWSDSARMLLTSTMKKLSEKKMNTVDNLMMYSTMMPLDKVQKFYSDTQVAAMMHKTSERTTASVRMTLSTALRSLRYLEETKSPFSVRDWIMDDQRKGWLFLVSKPEQRETLRPLLTTWLNVAINGLMSCEPNFKRRVWFIVDEKQSLNKIEAFPKALAEIRKYGGCIVSGLQNIGQIDQLYGNATSRSMVSNYNTKLFFRSPEANTAQWIAKTVGENEILEHNEGISFGAHQMRDGVSINEQKRQKAIVDYSDFMKLPNLTAYLQLSGEYPVTKVIFDYVDLPRITASFIPKKNKEEEMDLKEKQYNVVEFLKKKDEEQMEGSEVEESDDDEENYEEEGDMDNEETLNEDVSCGFKIGK